MRKRLNLCRSNSCILLIMVLLTGSSFLTSCVPNVYHHYSPDAEGGVVKKSMCGGQIGPKDMIEFSHNHVRISVKASEIQEGIKLELNMSIPEDNEVRIHSSSIKVSIPSSKNSYEGNLNSMYTSWQPGDVIIGETREFKTKSGSKWTMDKKVRMNSVISMPYFEMMILSLPEISVNNKQWDLPEITFKMEISLGMFPLNC